MAVFKLVLTALFRALYIFAIIPGRANACEGLDSQEMLGELSVCGSGLLHPALNGVNSSDNDLVATVRSCFFQYTYMFIELYREHGRF